jgi:hypothetical protein
VRVERGSYLGAWCILCDACLAARVEVVRAERTVQPETRGTHTSGRGAGRVCKRGHGVAGDNLQVSVRPKTGHMQYRCKTCRQIQKQTEAARRAPQKEHAA